MARRLLNNVRVILAACFLNGTHGAMTRALLQPFVLTLTPSMVFVGLVDGIANSLGPSAVQVAGGWLSDRIGRKPPLILGSLLVLAASLAFLASVATQEPALVLVGAMLLGSGTMGAPAREALVAESAGASRRLTAFNLLAVAAAAPGIFAAYVGGHLVARFDSYAVLFVVMACLETVVLALFVFFLRESARGSISDHMGVSQFRLFLRHVVTIPRGLRVFLSLVALDGFLWGLGYKILYGMLKKSEGLKPEEIGLLASTAIAAWVVFHGPIGRIMSRWGCLTCLVLSEITGALGLAGVMVFRASGVWALVPCAALTGLMPAFWTPAVRVLTVSSVGKESRAETLGKLALYNGAPGFLGAVLGGFLYEAGSILLPLGLNVAGAILMAVLLMTLVREGPANEVLGVDRPE